MATMWRSLVCLVAATSPAAGAQQVSVSLEPGTRHVTSQGVGSVGSGGGDYAGMVVTVRFADGSSDVAVWQADSPYAGGAVSGAKVGDEPLWRLSLGGDSFDSAWRLTHLHDVDLVAFTIDGGPASTVFDVIGSVSGTDGSSVGSTFRMVYTSDAALEVFDVVYRHEVAVGGFEPFGDLFRRMEVAVGEGGEGLDPGSVLEFTTDTDELAVDGDLAVVCVVDIDADGDLDLFDVMGYFQLYAMGDAAADRTGDGAINIFDVLAFFDAFAAGCPFL